MGTNYYFRPKGYDKLKELNVLTEKAMQDIQDNYINSINEMIKESNSISPLYEDLFNPSYDECRVNLHYLFEVPEIHICKISGGWVPLFEATKYYKSFKELEDFYYTYNAIIDIYDEYNNKIFFSSLKEKALKMKKSATCSHLSEEFNTISFIKYWKDSDGLEWTDSKDFC